MYDDLSKLAESRHEASDRARELVDRVRRIADASVDAVADTRGLEAVVTATEDVPLLDRIILTTANGGPTLALAENAHRQLAERTGIPRPYYTRMLESQPDLLAANVNRWLRAEPDTRLLRCLNPLGPGDAAALARVGADLRLRAILGRSFLPLDNAHLLREVIPEAEAAGVFLRDFDLTDQRLYARFVGPERTIADIRAEYAARYNVGVDEVARHLRVNGRDISCVEEPMRFGFTVRNSETGHAALDVRAFFDVLKCLNAYVAHITAKARHVGRRLVAGQEWDSDETRRLRVQTVMSEMRDAVREACDVEATARSAVAVANAKAAELPLDRPIEWIGNLSTRLGLGAAEADAVKEAFVEARGVERSTTQFAVAQAFTAAAQHAPSFDRRVEFEAIGWDVLIENTDRLLQRGRSAK